MNYLPISQLPIIEEAEASAEAAQIYADIQRTLNIPFVPNIYKTPATSAVVLAGLWDVFRQTFLQSALPVSLKAMILFSVSQANRCDYCSAVHEVTCRTVGIDETTLTALSKDLSLLEPRRIQAIVNFAVKCATDRHNLVEADYEAVREQGVSDEELMEIIALAALGNYLDTLADTMKIEIDSIFTEALNKK